MPTRTLHLPSVDDLPLRCGPEEVAAVLATLDASGLIPKEFSRRTGIPIQRIRRWRARAAVPAPVRLVEVVPAARIEAAVPRDAPPETYVEVASPSGWRLRVPSALLGDLVRALSC